MPPSSLWWPGGFWPERSRRQAKECAASAALFWALHPLRVESVAWATERRDVLSGFFFLLTALTYVRAAEGEGPQRRRLLTWSVGSYALAIASKATVVT